MRRFIIDLNAAKRAWEIVQQDHTHDQVSERQGVMQTYEHIIRQSELDWKALWVTKDGPEMNVGMSDLAKLSCEVIVAVLVNITKKSLFTVDERVEMLTEVTKDYGNVRVERFHGLTVDFCVANGVNIIVKGLRAVSDFEYEMQMAQMNYRLAKIETMFMTTNPLYSFLSSSLVKEIAKYGGDVSGLVPEPVLSRLHARLSEE